MRILYPVFWTRLGRQASWEQAANTVAALARRGHELTLLMPQGADDPALSAADVRAWFDIAGDFRVHQRPSRWSGERLHRTLVWLAQVFRGPELRAADLLYSRIPAMLAIGRGCPIPYATDHYRPWPDELPLIRPLVRWSAGAPHCLGVILHSHYAAGAYHRAGVPQDRLLVAHNGFDPPAEQLDKLAARRRLRLPEGRKIAVYAGRLDGTKGLDTVLALAELRPEVLFVLVGSEGDGEIERAATLRANVRVIGWTAPPLLPAWLFAADVLVIPPSRAPLERARTCVLPMKVFAYLAAGRPILAPHSPDTAELLEHGRTAWLVPPDDAASAAEGLDRLLADEPLGERLSAAASRLSADLTWDRRGEVVAEFLQARLRQVGERAVPDRPVATPARS
jgi:glycosyltransferase involved in cell wall biosynthesis